MNLGKFTDKRKQLIGKYKRFNKWTEFIDK